jgi:hypothetical protein
MQNFSGHCHSVIADHAVPIDRVALFKITVDIDSALAVFKRRNVSAERKTIGKNLKEVSDILDENWIGVSKLYKLLCQQRLDQSAP